jgi:hypothetical protein
VVGLEPKELIIFEHKGYSPSEATFKSSTGSYYELRTILPKLKESETSEHTKVAIYTRF